MAQTAPIAPATPSPRWDALAAMLVLAACLATRLPTFGYPAATTDEQLYSAIGQAILAGELPYVDVWDRKPIGLFLLFALGHLIAGPSPLGFQLIAFAFAAAGGWLVQRIARRTVPPLTAALAGALYPVGIALLGSQSGQSEVFWALPMLVMAWCVLRLLDDPGRRRLGWAAMLAGGLALQIKYTVAPQCAVLGVAALWARRRGRVPSAGLIGQATLYASIGLAPTVLVAGSYAVIGHLDAFLFANFESIFLRGPAAGLDPRVAPLLGLMAALAAAGTVYLLAVAPERGTADHAIIFAWLAGAGATLFMGTTVYVYYLAGLVAPTILAALPFLDQRNRFGAAPAALLLALALVKFDPGARYRDRLADEAELATVDAELRPRLARPGAFLFVHDGPTALYGARSSRPPSVLLYPDHFNNALEARALPVVPDREVARLLSCRPAAVVTSPDAMTDRNLSAEAALRRGLTIGYRKMKTMPFDDRRLDLWLPANPAEAPAHPQCLATLSESQSAQDH